MGMRETPRSLRAWFGVVGGLVLAKTLGGILSHDGDPWKFVGTLVGLVFGVAYVYICSRLPGLLVESPRKIINIILASSVILGLAAVVELATSNVASLVVPVVQLLINWYLVRNTKRLALEAKRGAP